MPQASSQFLAMQKQKFAIQNQIQIQQRAIEFARRDTGKAPRVKLSNEQKPRTIEELRKMNQVIKEPSNLKQTERERFNAMLEEQRQERRQRMSEFVIQKNLTIERKKLEAEQRGQAEKKEQIDMLKTLQLRKEERLNEVKYKKFVMTEEKRRFLENQCRKEILRNLERGQELERQQQVNERQERELQRMRRQLEDLKRMRNDI